jgi:hypothetical protein
MFIFSNIITLFLSMYGYICLRNVIM